MPKRTAVLAVTRLIEAGALADGLAWALAAPSR